CSFRNQRHSARVWSGMADSARRFTIRRINWPPSVQTGAGKTHTMEGPNMLIDDPESSGILPRVAKEIFVRINATAAPSEYKVALSVVEIYMERIRDLYDVSKDNLVVKEDQTRGISIAGVTEIYVEGEKEMLQLLEVPCSLTFRTCSLKLSRAVNSFLSGCDQESGCWGD
ncbi:unnamed protein product, partial [Closterium sp. NIES-54]